MPDMIVNLRNLLEIRKPPPEMKVRRAHTRDKHFLREWVKSHFGVGWAQCIDVALEQRPVTCFVIVESLQPYDYLLGFACYDVAARGVLGPMGIQDEDKGKGLGTSLLLTTLHAMHSEGYAYSIIGQVGPASFYTKVAGATIIEGSDPGTAYTRLEGARKE